MKITYKSNIRCPKIQDRAKSNNHNKFLVVKIIPL